MSQYLDFLVSKDKKDLMINEVTVSGTRIEENTPTTYDTIDKEEIGIMIIGECQSLLYNFENELIKLFGKDYALNEIQKLVEDFKVNEITEDELTHAKNYIKHQIKSSMDHQSYLTKSIFLKSILGEKTTTKQRLERLDKVQLKDVIKISKSIKLDTSYALYGGIK